MHRGDIVLCVEKGSDYAGKPRPVVVVEADKFLSAREGVTVCPISSVLISAPDFRLRLHGSEQNGLNVDSDVMVDKITTVSRARIGKKIGELEAGQLELLDSLIKNWLGLV